MNFINVLCLNRPVPDVAVFEGGVSTDPEIKKGQVNHAVLFDMDSETGELTAPVRSKCLRMVPPNPGFYVARVATDTSFGITQVGTVEWMPLGPVFSLFCNRNLVERRK